MADVILSAHFVCLHFFMCLAVSGCKYDHDERQNAAKDNEPAIISPYSEDYESYEEEEGY